MFVSYGYHRVCNVWYIMCVYIYLILHITTTYDNGKRERIRSFSLVPDESLATANLLFLCLMNF